MSGTPVIIKLHPEPEEYVEAETAFLRAVGLCITQWAFVDRQLFRLFKLGLGTSAERAALLYYGQNALGRRLSQVDGLLTSALSEARHEAYRQEWQSLRKRVTELLPTRNMVAHQPVRRTGASDGTKAVYVYSIYIEPYQRHLTRTHKGLMGKEELRTDDLIRHSTEVEEVHADLATFVRDILRGTKG
jgi:hypothetical protein